MTKKNSHTSLVGGVVLVIFVVYFLLIPALAQPEYRGGLPIISDPNYFVKPLSVEHVVTTVTTATSSQPYWQTAFLTQTSYATQTQTVSASTTPPSPSGATCSIALSRTEMNMGENLAGQLASNRPGVEVVVFQRLMGEETHEVLRGITDGSGKYIAASGSIDQPGIYQIFAALDFPAQGVQVPCTPVITVTVHGLRISVNPDSIPKGILSDITIDVYSDHPGSTIMIEDQTSASPTWWASTSVTTNAGGHGTRVLHVMTGSDWWKFRAIDPVDGSPSVNEEWLSVT